MRLNKILQVGLCVAALSGIFATSAKADDYNKKTVVTFREAVQIPGQVLPPGTYTFMLLDSPANRNVVEVWNADQNHLFASLETNSELQWRPPDRPMYYANQPSFQLEEQGPDQPMLLRSFYFPSYQERQDFIYRSPNVH
jgi:hypothetical protein